MQSKILITFLVAALLSSCNGKKDGNESTAGKGVSGNKATSTLVTDLMKVEFRMTSDLNLRDAEKENFIDEINGTKVEYTKYTYTLLNSKIVKKSEVGGAPHCTLTAALRADRNPDSAVLEAASKIVLNRTQYNGKSNETNGSGTSSSKLVMALGYGHKDVATVLNIVCLEISTLDELKSQIGEIISIQKAEPNGSSK